MDIQIIALWIGLFITFALGLINFLWGGAILARREKVAIVKPEVYIYFLPKGVQSVGDYKKPAAIKNHALQIIVECSLVLTSGEKEIGVNSVYFKLEKRIYDRLKEYFRPPYAAPSYIFSFHLSTWAPQIADREPTAVLTPKKSADFIGEAFLPSTDKFDEKYEKLGIQPYPEGFQLEELIEAPDFIETMLNELMTKYQICWTRYDGKELCWHFPDKWWRNLGKRLWG